MKTVLLYVDDFDPELFAGLVQAAEEESIPLELQVRPNQPLAAVEWFVLPAVAAYIAKPFIDKFLAKASEDAVAAGYPRFKEALRSLVTRLYVLDRSRFKTLASGKSKVVDGGAWLFGVYSVSKSGKRLKFVFGDALTEDQYAKAVDELLKCLRAHHLDELDEEVAKGIGRLLNPSLPDVILLFNAEEGHWHVVDPILYFQAKPSDEP